MVPNFIVLLHLGMVSMIPITNNDDYDGDGRTGINMIKYD